VPPAEIPASLDDVTVVGAIPARWASTRLPGKALLPIGGRPMIEHVWRRAAAAEGLDRLVVLTDDERIAEAVAGFGGIVEMTPADCTSGTDRIAWAARHWPERAIVNIQGDEPLIEPAAVTRLAAHLRAHPEDPIVTLAAPAGPDLRDDPHVVKVVVNRTGCALYFSRAAIPYARGPAAPPLLRHLGIYGYQRSTLLELAELGPAPLEVAESLEQLRALENGVPIRVLIVPRAWPGVDTMSDLAEVERLLVSTWEEAGAWRPSTSS
jgi:3-deoxy-manno-octulosonate cytidylyltransferase (CMP-KDO synthetase)